MSEFTTPKTAAGEDAETQLRRLQGEVESLMRDTVTPAIVDAVDWVAAAAEYAGQRSALGLIPTWSLVMCASVRSWPSSSSAQLDIFSAARRDNR